MTCRLFSEQIPHLPGADSLASEAGASRVDQAGHAVGLACKPWMYGMDTATGHTSVCWLKVSASHYSDVAAPQL